MKFTWIHPTNVTQIARALLQLDHTYLQEQYRQDALSFVDQLRGALKHYQTPPRCEAEMKTWGTIENIEAALIRVLAEVKLFVALLTPEAQQQLAQQFQSEN